jgi:type II secretory pathway component PulF
MAIFVYKAKKGPTEIVHGEIEADSQDQVVNKLEEMGFAPVSVVEKERIAYSAERIEKDKLSAKRYPLNAEFIRVKSQDIDTFTRQLASLIRASVSVLRALSLISEQTENKVLKNVVSDLEEQVRDGRMLSEAMAKYPNIFNNLYLSMVKAGEKGGVLDEVLYKLAEHREKEQEIRRKIQSALAYPVLMIIVGAATVFVMLTFFLPKLIGMFERMRQSLPLPTRILIGISDFMSSNWLWFIIALGFIIAIFGRVKPGSKKKFLFDMVKLHLPFMQKFVKNAEIAKFARTLGLLLKNGLPVYESLDLATSTLDNDALRERLGQAGKEIVNQGSTLSNSLKKINIFPNFAVNMIAVGEEGGKLEQSLAEIANAYEREVEQAIKIMTSLLEPLLILTVGAVVGFIVFAMLLPIFNIGVMAR